MKQSVNFDDFARAFNDIRPDNFSYDGLRCLFEYLESLEEDTGKQIDLDVIALCCDYSEDSVTDISSSYDIDLSDCEDADDQREQVIHVLRENTSFAQAVNDDTIIYQQF